MKLTKVKTFDEAYALAIETKSQYDGYAPYVLTRKRKVIEEIGVIQYYVSEKGKMYYTLDSDGVILFNDFSNSSLTAGFPTIGIINEEKGFVNTQLTKDFSSRKGFDKFASSFLKDAKKKSTSVAASLLFAGVKINFDTDTIVFSKVDTEELTYLTK